MTPPSLEQLPLSRAAEKLIPSPTLASSARAQALMSEGKPVINLSVGELPYPTFLKAKQGGMEAIEHNMNRYTLPEGRKDVREKLVPFLQEEYGIKMGAQNIALGTGAKFLIYSALQMILNPGDEVLLPIPYWVSYPTMIDLVQGTTKLVATKKQNRFLPTPEDLEKAYSPKTKLLILCSPNNPTGAAFSREEIFELGEWLRSKPQVWLISDDIYNRLYFHPDKIAPHILQQCPDLKERVICIGGTSKSFCMTGWRLGWAVSSERVQKKISQFLSQTTSNPSTVAQQALFRVLEGYHDELEKVRIQVRDQARKTSKFWQKLDVETIEPQGAFYVFFSLKPWMKKYGFSSDLQCCQKILDELYVSVVAGSDFGMPGWARMSVTVEQEKLEEALDRLKKWLL